MSEQQTMISKQQIHKPEIDIAKGFGILLVVMGHALSCASAGGGNEVARILFDIIYSFHMALFIFLSGFLMTKVMQIKTIDRRISYIKNRANRLLIPYLFLSICFVPLKIFMERYTSTPYQIGNLWKIILGESPNYALWTLYTLFLFSIVAVFINTKKTLNIVVIIMFGLFLLNGFLKPELPIGIGMFLSKGIFYFLGLYTGIFYHKLQEFLEKKKILFISVSLIIFSVGNILTIKYFSEWKEFIAIFTGSTGICLVIILSNVISKRKGNRNIKKIMNSIGLYCMDIYVLSTLIQPVIRIILWSKLQLNYWVCVFLSVIFVVSMSVVISKTMIRKYQWMRKLILGMD